MYNNQYPPCMGCYPQPYENPQMMNMPNAAMPMPGTQIPNMPVYNMPMASMPINEMQNPNISMMNMPQNYQMGMPMQQDYQMGMPVQPDYQMGMMMPEMPMDMMYDEQPMTMQDRQLEMMNPRIYFMVMPMVKHHCDMMESMHGMMFCPSMEEMEKVKDNIYEKIDKDLDKDDDHHHDHHDDDCDCEHEEHDKDNKDEYRSDGDRQRRRYGRRRSIRDLISILLIGELLGRRRRRRRPHYGSGYGY